MHFHMHIPCPSFYRWGKLSPEKMHDLPTRHTLTCHHLRNILSPLYFTSSSGRPARFEKSELHWLLSQTSLASQVHSGCLLLNSYMRRNSRPGMLRPCFEVKDGKLRKTLSLISLTLQLAQLHASRAPKIHFINGYV